ncbi:MAG: serine hydrolase [Myxococcota bacterium]
MFLSAAAPGLALAAAPTWRVSYLWSRTLARVIEHRRAVSGVLGRELGAGLVVARNRAGQWGLIDAAPGPDRAAVQTLAAGRNEQLVAALGGHDVLAAAMPDGDAAIAHHVSYGALVSRADAEARRDRVGQALGAEVAAALALVGGGGRWEVRCERYGDPVDAELVAALHTALLAAHGIPAVAVPDRYFDPGWTNAAPAVAADPLDLPATSDTALRDAINRYVQQLRHEGRIAPDETTSWYVQTLHDDRTWAAINADRPLQCASMVKPYVALAFLHRVAEGHIVYGALSRGKLEAMIRDSNNAATNWAMNTLGGPGAVQSILTRHYGHLLRETTISEEIPANGRTYRNRSSARDYVRFSRALWRRELPNSDELRRLMALPGRDRLFDGAPAIPEGTEVMDKTGTTARLCGDFGILVARTPGGERVPYAIVGIIEKSESASAYGAWVAARGAVIRSVSNVVYLSLKDQYGLV